MSADDLTKYLGEFDPNLLYTNELEFDNISENNDPYEQSYIYKQTTSTNPIKFGVKEPAIPADEPSILGKKFQIQLPIMSMNKETPLPRMLYFYLKICVLNKIIQDPSHLLESTSRNQVATMSTQAYNVQSNLVTIAPVVSVATPTILKPAMRFIVSENGFLQQIRPGEWFYSKKCIWKTTLQDISQLAESLSQNQGTSTSKQVAEAQRNLVATPMVWSNVVRNVVPQKGSQQKFVLREFNLHLKICVLNETI